LIVPKIDPTARVADGARLADDVEVGPYCIVGSEVELQSGVRLMSHVNLAGVTVIGERTVIYPFASLGTPPQSFSYGGEPTRLVIGPDCTIRESVTMNTGTAQGGGVTEVGARGYFMPYCHVAHDCRIGSDVVFANSATLGGHCTIGDYVVIGGLTAVHQHTRIGAHAMISGITGLRGDVIPFGLAAGSFARLSGINAVGMRRRSFSRESIRAVRSAFRALFFGEGLLAQRLEAVEAQFGKDEAVAQIIQFVRQGRNRPLCHPGRLNETDA
jgi:UDP-N-acetylglucosamine acyltransferase